MEASSSGLSTTALNSIEAELEVALKTFSGERVWSDSVAKSVGANQVAVVWRADATRLDVDSRHVLTVRAHNNLRSTEPALLRAD